MYQLFSYGVKISIAVLRALVSRASIAGVSNFVGDVRCFVGLQVRMSGVEQGYVKMLAHL